MKVKFYLPEDPSIVESEVHKTIRKKMFNKIVEIPCIPTKEMQVDISSFEEIFGFSKEETEWIEDCNQIFFITNIFIKPTHLEVWLEYKYRPIMGYNVNNKHSKRI